MNAVTDPATGLRLLWTDGQDAPARLAALRKSGAVSQSEADDLAFFIDHGWLIWRNAIPAELIDAFAAEVRGHHHAPGMFLTTNHRNGQSRLRLSGDTPDRFESLFDLYVNLESSRQVALHPRVTRFLSLVFDAQPVAFQQLLFQRSNGHDVHQDTSVVAVEEPCLLAATWIALEDVVPGAGELAFYDRSHKIPHVLFKNGSKRIDFAADDPKAYAAKLDAACRERGLAYETFLAKKGDLLFWTADLVHRSHPRTLPQETSRLSCVTHYHPDTTTPFWFRHNPEKRHFEPYENRAALASVHYTLKVRAAFPGLGMLQPNSPFGG
jgi:ectoine hydroxylase-related dioxygenase (phytanoyl-CoA dioxygenase family)